MRYSDITFQKRKKKSIVEFTIAYDGFLLASKLKTNTQIMFRVSMVSLRPMPACPWAISPVKDRSLKSLFLLFTPLMSSEP